MFDMKDAINVANILGIKFDNFSLQDLLEGINVELEHGSINPSTDVTHDNLIMTAKIALAHLNEFPNYYNKEYGIKTFERYLSSKIKKD